jgi:kynurenine formamidase
MTAADPNGADGALSRLGPSELLKAVSLIRKGRVFDLGMEINHKMPQGPRPALVPFSLLFSTTPETDDPSLPFTVAMEAIIGALHTSTHIDAFVHVQSDGKVFDDTPAAAIRTDAGFTIQGADTIPPIVGRGVVLDVALACGVDQLDDGYEITVEDLQRAYELSGTAPDSGDVVLVRTGKIREFWSDPEKFDESQPGVGASAAVWLYERGMVVLGTDTSGTEPFPFRGNRSTHVEMLTRRGVHLIESLNLEEAAGHGPGLFICLPLRITGATGSWVRPVLLT